jgi:type I restriction enzyme, S subunit
MNYPSLPISSFCSTGSGGTPSRANVDGYYDGTIPWVKSGELREDIILDTEEKITELALRESSAKLVPKGALLIAMYGATIGRIAELGVDGTTNQAVCHIVPDPKVADKRYLFYGLRSKVPELIKQGAGGAQPNINQQIIRDTQIPLPPLPEQKRIAAILDKADAIRRKRQQAVKLTEELLRSVFLDMFGDPVTNPKGWEKVTLGDVAIQVTDGEHQTPVRTTEGVKLLSARNIRNGNIDVNDVDYVSIEEHERIKRRCNPVRGDILISCSGTIGRVTTVETDEPFSLVRSVAMVKLKATSITSKYLEHYLRTPALQRIMQNNANSSSQANLFQNQIRDLPVCLPKLDYQQQFTNKISVVEKIVAMHGGALAEHATLFTSLLQRAFRGEL